MNLQPSWRLLAKAYCRDSTAAEFYKIDCTSPASSDADGTGNRQDHLK